jgi:hypothetical protein
MRTILRRQTWFLFTLALVVPGLAGAADREVLGRFPVPQAAESCASALRPVSAVPGAEEELTSLHSAQSKGLASIGDLLAQTGLKPAFGQAAFVEEQDRTLYLVPLAAAGPGAAHVAMVVREGGEATAFLLTMRAGDDGEPRHLTLSTLDGSAAYGLDLETGVVWTKGLVSVSQPDVADTLSCLWSAITSGLPSLGGITCALRAVITTCVSNFTQCLGAVQGALTNIACASGVNIVRNAVGCFNSGADTLPPVISSLSPSDNATVNSPFDISCSASDTSGLQTISLLVDSVVVRSCSSSPCSTSYTAPSSTSDRQYRVSCVAVDRVGNSEARIHTVTVSSRGGGGTGSGNALQNGVPVGGLSGAQGSSQVYRITVPPGRSRLEVRTSGGTGDVDLSVRRGAQPTTFSYNCRSAGSSNSETCAINNPSSGDWYILLKGYRTYSGVTLVASY